MMQKPNSRRICFIPGCPSQVGQVIFLSAYKSDGLQRWWSESAWSDRRKNKTIPKNTRVCEKHFEEKYIDRSYKMPRLFPDAWPTMNLIEPTPEELAKHRIDGRGRPREVKPEFNPKAFCRLCGRKEKRSLEDQLDHLRDGEEVLKFCLGRYYARQDLPRGVCLNCMETAESFVDFVKTCEEVQRKLDAMFNPNEALKIEPECEILENISLKQEKIDEPLEEISEDQYETEYLVEVIDDQKITEVKSEDVIESKEEDDDHDFPALDDDRAMSSDSSHSDDDEFDPNEDKKKSPNYHITSSTSSFSDSEVDSDDEPLARRRQPKKKLGAKPRQTIKIREDLGTLDVVDEFPASEKKERKKPSPGQRKGPKGRKASASGPGETSRICPICGKILVHKGNFTSHLKIHSEKKDYVCNICGKQYYIRRELQMHIESLHEKKTFVCNICGIKCAWRKGLQRHMKNKHSDESSLKHKCTYCGKAFLLPNQLRLHVMKHTGDRITCEICGAGYRFNYMLTQHKMREHGMEFKGVKLYKTSSRSRKHGGSSKSEVDSTAAAVASIAPQETAIVNASTPVHPHQSSSAHSVANVSAHVLEHSHDSILSSESSQSHPIPQHQHQQQQQHHQSLQYQHPVLPASQLERVHYPPGFVYAGLTGAAPPPTMMLPPGGYSG